MNIFEKIVLKILSEENSIPNIDMSENRISFTTDVQDHSMLVSKKEALELYRFCKKNKIMK